MKVFNGLSLQEWILKRKIRRKMMRVLKVGYQVDVSRLKKCRETVFGKPHLERLLDIFIIDMATKDFSNFHRTVRPIGRRLELKFMGWEQVITLDGNLVDWEAFGEVECHED